MWTSQAPRAIALTLDDSPDPIYIGGGDRSNTVAALQIFIPELIARGFVFASVSLA